MKSRKPLAIIAAAIVLYAVVMAVCWWRGTCAANKRAEDILKSADRGFSATIGGEIEAALKNASGAIINFFGGKARPVPMAKMQEIANLFNIDEINFVGRDGRVISSNVKSVLGVNFNDKDVTREFMVLTEEDGDVSCVTQPFRHGSANPEMFCKYLGASFPDREAFIQLGMSVERLRQNMYTYSEKEAERILRDWKFSVVGWYERSDGDPAFSKGKMFQTVDARTGERVFARYFDSSGFRYRALLPMSFCYEQRNVIFVATAFGVAVLLGLFAYFLVRLTFASARIEAMHAAAEKRTAADLALARMIQMSLLPSARAIYADRLDFTIFAESVPAREVGGDFYDFFGVSGGKIAFIVADVSGKGISAAMFMMEARAVLKNCILEFPLLDEAVCEANMRLCAHNEAEMFVTAWVGVLDPATGMVEYVNAGHNRPFLRHEDGTVEKILGRGGRFLGMFEEAHYRVNSMELKRNDCVFLYTDGVTEAMNAAGEMFGEKRLCGALSAGNLSPKDVVKDFVGAAEPSDDLTCMAVCWHGAPTVSEQTFAGVEASLSKALVFLRGALDGLDKKSCAAILNAVDEIVANVVGYSGTDDFRIRVERSPFKLRVQVIDSGAPYNPLTHVDPDTHAAIEDRPIGGLGLVMVKRLADRVTYLCKDGKNIFTIIKRTDIT